MWQLSSLLSSTQHTSLTRNCSKHQVCFLPFPSFFFCSFLSSLSFIPFLPCFPSLPLLHQQSQMHAFLADVRNGGPRGDEVCLNHLYVNRNYGQSIGVAHLGGACNPSTTVLYACVWLVQFPLLSLIAFGSPSAEDSFKRGYVNTGLSSSYYGKPSTCVAHICLCS